jgi:glycosyltransferase involved in cell wall biosynthesis
MLERTTPESHQPVKPRQAPPPFRTDPAVMAGRNGNVPAPMAISVIIPAYNEENGVGAVVQRVDAVLREAGIEHEIIVVDDGSKDNTRLAAEEAGAVVLRHPCNRGYGASLKTGILVAAYDVICITDADGTYPVERIPDLLAELRTADMVVGARTGTRVAIPLIRKPAKWVLNRLANYITSSKIPDLNSGLRLFRRDAALQYFHMLPDQFSFTTTITMAMLCDKYAVTYVPIDYKRRTGKSKIVPWDAASFTILILRMAMLFRPLRVFLPCALVCLLYAVGKLCYDFGIAHDRMISTTAAVGMVSALQIVLIGMLGEAIGTRLWHIGGPRYVGVLSRSLGRRIPNGCANRGMGQDAELEAVSLLGEPESEEAVQEAVRER